MATKATVQKANNTQMRFTVAAGQTATEGMPAIFGAGDLLVQDAGAASDVVFGFFDGSAAAGEQVAVNLVGPVIKAKVGTGNSTRGEKQASVANGVTDAGVAAAIVGIALQSGVAGDLIGLIQVGGSSA